MPVTRLTRAEYLNKSPARISSAPFLFLIVPFTLVAIALYQAFVNPGYSDLPILFSVPNILPFVFLFPIFHTLALMLENDHTMCIHDTVIMVSIVGLLLLLFSCLRLNLLVVYKT
jgi:hypothetical protein